MSNSANSVMLCGGIGLLTVLLCLLTYCVMKGKPYAALVGFLPIAVIMIGFSAISKFKVPGIEVELRDAADKVIEKPNDPGAQEELGKALDASFSKNSPGGITPEARSRLVTVARTLGEHTNLSPESRLTLSKVQLALGQTNQAVANFHSAIKANTNLILRVNPKLRMILKATP